MFYFGFHSTEIEPNKKSPEFILYLQECGLWTLSFKIQDIVLVFAAKEAAEQLRTEIDNIINDAAIIVHIEQARKSAQL